MAVVICLLVILYLFEMGFPLCGSGWSQTQLILLSPPPICGDHSSLLDLSSNMGFIFFNNQPTSICLPNVCFY